MTFELVPFRSVGKTQMNEQSSRSHFVFTMRITGVNEVQAHFSSMICANIMLFLSQSFLPWSNAIYCSFDHVSVCLPEHWTTSTRCPKSNRSCWKWASFQEWLNRRSIKRDSSIFNYTYHLIRYMLFFVSMFEFSILFRQSIEVYLL